jgi:hypothetical protein
MSKGPRYKLSPEDGKIVEQVLSVMQEAGYTDKSCRDRRSNLRGLLSRGYDLLRTPEGRSALAQERTSYPAQKAVKKSMGLIATVYGLEVGITLSRKGVVSVHRHLSSTALWPPADALAASFDLASAADRLTERRNSTNHGPGRPVRGRTWGEMVEALKKGNRMTRSTWAGPTYLEWKPSAGEVFIFNAIGSDEECARREIEWAGKTHIPTTGDLIADDWAFYTAQGSEP